MKYILIIFLALGICGCKNTTGDENSVEEVKYTGPNIASMTDLIESISVIPLESKDSVMWGSGPIVLHRDTSFYIVDRFTTGQIIRFSENGKFLNSIAKIGRAPGEYLNLKNVYIDPDSDNILVHAQPDFSLYCYSKTGAFKWKKYSELTVLSFAMNGDHLWLSMGYNNPRGPERLLLTDTSFHIKKAFLPFETKIYAIFGATPFTYYESDIYFREELDPQVYCIEGDSLRPIINFDFGAYNVPKSFFKTDEPTQSFIDLDKKGFSYIKNFWNSKDHLLIEATKQKDMDCSFIYGIKNKKKNQWSWIEYNPLSPNLFVNKIKGFTLNNQLLLLVSGNDLLAIKEEEKSLIKNIDKINFNSNDLENEMFIFLCNIK